MLQQEQGLAYLKVTQHGPTVMMQYMNQTIAGETQ